MIEQKNLATEDEKKKIAENREYFKRALAEAMERKKHTQDAEFLAFLASLNAQDSFDSED